MRNLIQSSNQRRPLPRNPHSIYASLYAYTVALIMSYTIQYVVTQAMLAGNPVSCPVLPADTRAVFHQAGYFVIALNFKHCHF